MISAGCLAVIGNLLGFPVCTVDVGNKIAKAIDVDHLPAKAVITRFGRWEVIDNWPICGRAEFL